MHVSSWWSTTGPSSEIAINFRIVRSPTVMSWNSCISWAVGEVTATLQPFSEVTADSPFTIAGREFRSRLMVGTGKYASNDQMLAAIEASGAEVVTVAVR